MCYNEVILKGLKADIMKTLIFNGSPHKNGDTASLTGRLTGLLEGSFTEVFAYDEGIAPCNDCRSCIKNSGCAINDDMQRVYRLIAQCDNIVIASPIHFSALTGRLLCIASRLQTLYCARAFRGEEPVAKAKKGRYHPYRRR